MIHNLSSHKSILNKFLYEMRSVEKQKTACAFASTWKRMGEIMAYEISKHLDYEIIHSETPLGEANMEVPKDSIVLASILRAGLPLTGLPQFWWCGKWLCFCLSVAIHKDGTFDIKLEYITCPNIEGKRYWSCWIQCWLQVPAFTRRWNILKNMAIPNKYTWFRWLLPVRGETHPAFFFPMLKFGRVPLTKNLLPSPILFRDWNAGDLLFWCKITGVNLVVQFVFDLALSQPSRWSNCYRFIYFWSSRRGKPAWSSGILF